MPLISYIFVFFPAALTCVGLVLGGWWTWLQPAVLFGLVPLSELFFKGTTANRPKEGEAGRKNHWISRMILLGIFPTQLAMVVGLLWQANHLESWALMGAIVSVGSTLGAMGITGAHEIGHQRGAGAKLTAEGILLLTLYLHFVIEHNRGHHAKVATPEDPASAPEGQTVYGFWWQSLKGSLVSAWALERTRLGREDLSPWTMQNTLLRYLTIEAGLVLVLGIALGMKPTLAFVGASFVGILLLETVNYMQHYGLQRKRLENGSYERVSPKHSWTSNHTPSRLLLIDLPRHADHHAAAGRHFSNLRHLPESPVLPWGYPGMLLMALIPPLFKYVMGAALRAHHETAA